MKLVAHRGLHQNGVAENSLEAFQKAIANDDYVGFEFDIRTSKDGVFVIHHDLFIDGNLIRFLDYSELKEKYHILSLEEVFKLKTSKIMLLEIKEANLDTVALNELINKYPHTNLYIDSFDNSIIHQMKKMNNHAKYGVLNYVLNSEENYKDYDFIGLLSGVITDDLINFFKKNKIEVFIYGILNKKHIGKYQDVYYIVD
ncbi:MAG: glycerophosphodiester phosphodiesterase [Bacilli bacterium]|nr:glycerophosphodiester phosphodiesterase [Bacilli bacterium]